MRREEEDEEERGREEKGLMTWEERNMKCGSKKDVNQ